MFGMKLTWIRKSYRIIFFLKKLWKKNLSNLIFWLHLNFILNCSNRIAVTLIFSLFMNNIACFSQQQRYMFCFAVGGVWVWGCGDWHTGTSSIARNNDNTICSFFLNIILIIFVNSCIYLWHRWIWLRRHLSYCSIHLGHRYMFGQIVLFYIDVKEIKWLWLWINGYHIWT